LKVFLLKENVSVIVSSECNAQIWEDRESAMHHTLASIRKTCRLLWSLWKAKKWDSGTFFLL